jgi:hypothetical protein
MTDKKPISEEPLLSIRMYLLIKALERGAGFSQAWEAVNSTLLDVANPDPNLRYYAQWEALYARETKNARSN